MSCNSYVDEFIVFISSVRFASKIFFAVRQSDITKLINVASVGRWVLNAGVMNVSFGANASTVLIVIMSYLRKRIRFGAIVVIFIDCNLKE